MAKPRQSCARRVKARKRELLVDYRVSSVPPRIGRRYRTEGNRSTHHHADPIDQALMWPVGLHALPWPRPRGSSRRRSRARRHRLERGARRSFEQARAARNLLMAEYDDGRRSLRRNALWRGGQRPAGVGPRGVNCAANCSFRGARGTAVSPVQQLRGVHEQCAY